MLSLNGIKRGVLWSVCKIENKFYVKLYLSILIWRPSVHKMLILTETPIRTCEASVEKWNFMKPIRRTVQLKNDGINYAI